ncbi:rhamnulose-1-phosphate aldolase [Sediminibacillus massiliensis]|uniref:rhamnulose-1-phosphate aldolase n=1 Tax=Sediminibacillus massiliensis TaxID=1926277 RepID=UPI001C4DE790|nr:rhamnulose-1-phosphate aldolase [Sediminibacillus massiliensis]
MKILQDMVRDHSVLNAPFVQEMMDATYDMWRFGWDERNGGNISLLLEEEEVLAYLDPDRVIRTIGLEFPVQELSNRYFIVTGSGKYFKNVRKYPEDCLGIIRVSEEGKSVELLWGLAGDGRPTSELASHFMSHIARLNADSKHRVIMHTHATNLIAMTFTHALDEVSFTKTLWKMCTECVVVFPEGVAILPWMVPGTDLIGKQTAAKMEEHKLVVWPHHGILGAGSSIDDAFGLIETAEKAAQIYMLVCSHKGGIQQTITDGELIELAKAFDVRPPDRFFHLKQKALS